MTEYTAIIPVDLSARPDDIMRKSLLLAEAFSKRSARIVFAHNNRGSVADKQYVQALSLSKSEGVKVVSDKFYDGVVNPALLRNQAFAHVETDVILLLDVDIFPDMELFQHYADAVAAKEASFFILPCLYLTQCGTDKLLKGKMSIASLKAKYYDFSRRYFLHLASPSSIIFMVRGTYQDLNGFDERFSGHGYEDFDFMVRLAAHFGLISKPRDFMENIVARSPLFAQGYRRELGRLVIPALLKKNLVYHLFHERGGRADYSAQRHRNFELFKSKNKSEPSMTEPVDKTLLIAFVKAAEEIGVEVAEYSVYFDNKPGHVDRFDTFKRRLRFLFNQ